MDLGGRRNKSYLAGLDVVVPGGKSGEHKLAVLIAPAHPHFVGIGMSEADRRSGNDLPPCGAHDTGGAGRRCGGSGGWSGSALLSLLRRGCRRLRLRRLLVSRSGDGSAKEYKSHASVAEGELQFSLAFPSRGWSRLTAEALYQRRTAHFENKEGSGSGTSNNDVARTAAAGPTEKTKRQATPFQLAFARSYTCRYVIGSLRFGFSIFVLTNNSLPSGESS